MIFDRRYTDREMTDIRDELVSFFKEHVPDITDYNESDFTMMYIEALAGIADMLGFYLDNQSLETFLATARQPKNIRNILTTMNYPVEAIGSAKGVVKLTINPESVGLVTSGDIIIPRYTRLGTIYVDGPEYVTDDDVIFFRGEYEKEVTVTQGERKELSVRSLTLKKSYKYYLPEDKIPTDSVFIIQDGTLWDRVEDAFVELDGGRKYSVHCDARGRVYIMFTYDWKDFLPTEDSDTVTIQYLSSAGEAGLVNRFDIVKVLDSIDDGAGHDITDDIIVTNEDKTYGAFDSANLTLAKANARIFIQSMGRCINIADYNSYLLKEDYILKVVTMDWHTNPEFVEVPNVVRAWVVTSDGVDVNELYLKELSERTQRRGIALNEVEVRSADFALVSTIVKISINTKNQAEKERIMKNLEEVYKEEFALEKGEFGQKISQDRFKVLAYEQSNLIKDVTVSMRVNGHTVRTDVGLTAIQFPIYTNIQVQEVGVDETQNGQTRFG